MGVSVVTIGGLPPPTPEYLSKLWEIPLKTARQTLNSTTHDTIRIMERGDIQRQFQTKMHQCAYNQLGGYLSQF